LGRMAMASLALATDCSSGFAVTSDDLGDFRFVAGGRCWLIPCCSTGAFPEALVCHLGFVL
jgi:hypothetical protein